MTEPGFTELTSTPGGDARTIVETAQAAAEPKVLDPEQQLYAIAGDAVKVVDLEKHLEAPLRTRGTYQLMTLESLISFVGQFDKPVVWVHPTEGSIVAVLNETYPGQPGWGDHRAQFSPIKTDEWNFWIANDGRMLEQVAFAQHIEDGIAEIVDPPAADMLEIAQTIQAATDVNFRSSQRLSDGQTQVNYAEEVSASAGTTGELTVPQEFELGIAPFVGEDPFKLKARLRIRIDRGDLKMGYRLERPADVLREVIDEMAEKLGQTFGDSVYKGAPAQARS